MFRFCCSANIEANLVIGAECHYPKSAEQISALCSSKTSIDSLQRGYLPQERENYPKTQESHENVSSRYTLKYLTTVGSATKDSSRKSSEKSSFVSWIQNEDYQLLDILYDTSSRTSTASRSSDSYIPIPMTRILSHLYLGSYDDAIDEPQLKAKGITHIISLIGKKSAVDFVQTERFPMHDHGKSNLKVVLEKVFNFLELRHLDGKVVLIHCLSGQNRSATVVIALLMIGKKKTLHSAYKMVKSLRPVIQINKRYAKQLLALEREIFGKNTLPCDWMERGDIDNATDDVTYKCDNLDSI